MTGTLILLVSELIVPPVFLADTKELNQVVLAGEGAVCSLRNGVCGELRSASDRREAPRRTVAVFLTCHLQFPFAVQQGMVSLEAQ